MYFTWSIKYSIKNFIQNFSYPKKQNKPDCFLIYCTFVQPYYINVVNGTTYYAKNSRDSNLFLIAQSYYYKSMLL